MAWKLKTKKQTEEYLASESSKYLLTESGFRLWITDLNWFTKNKNITSAWSTKNKTI